MIILDTSGLLAALDAGEVAHHDALAAIKASEGVRCLSPYVLAELDYLLTTRVSSRDARRLLDEVAKGAYQLEQFDATDIARAIEILNDYTDLDIGLTDASLVVLAERYGTRDILTLDERHFRALRTASGGSFRVLPADIAT